jgi:ribosomal protein S8
MGKKIINKNKLTDSEVTLTGRLPLKNMLAHLYNPYLYRKKMGMCKDCKLIKRTAKYLRPARYYCGYDLKYGLFNEKTIQFVTQINLRCNNFEPKKSFIKQQNNSNSKRRP